ncbi:MAG: hypothetical protein GX660_25640 [Clostridiaceae bacterium]|nr:hypothetical protein [Clostridiaceae bacterium]
MKNIVVVKSSSFLTQTEKESIATEIKEMIKDGIVILDGLITDFEIVSVPYFDCLYVE